jgi:hypothetical protein
MYTECWENLKERDYLEYPIVSARIILKWLLDKYNGSAWA